jgi:hypothetical protein
MRVLGSTLALGASVTLALGASVTIKGNTGPKGQTSFLGSLWYVGAAIHQSLTVVYCAVSPRVTRTS